MTLSHLVDRRRWGTWVSAHQPDEPSGRLDLLRVPQSGAPPTAAARSPVVEARSVDGDRSRGTGLLPAAPRRRCRTAGTMRHAGLSCVDTESRYASTVERRRAGGPTVTGHHEMDADVVGEGGAHPAGGCGHPLVAGVGRGGLSNSSKVKCVRTDPLRDGLSEQVLQAGLRRRRWSATRPPAGRGPGPCAARGSRRAVPGPWTSPWWWGRSAGRAPERRRGCGSGRRFRTDRRPGAAGPRADRGRGWRPRCRTRRARPPGPVRAGPG